MSKPIYLAIASPKGGVGKTSLTVLSASILHYHRGCNVAVVDCNHPVYTIARLRQQESEDLNHQRLMRLKHRTAYAPYPIICTPVREALRRVEQHCVDSHPRCILFDLPPIDAYRRDGGVAFGNECRRLSRYGQSDGYGSRPPFHRHLGRTDTDYGQGQYP